MEQRLDEPVTVTLAPNGEPRTFVWARFEYEVIGQPQAYHRRDDVGWWRRRGDPTRIDRPYWRVEATATGDAADAQLYDLARRPDGKGWLLARAWG